MYPLLPTLLPGLHGTIHFLWGIFRESASKRVVHFRGRVLRAMHLAIVWRSVGAWTVARWLRWGARFSCEAQEPESGFSNGARFGDPIRPRRNQGYPLVC